MAFFHLDEMCKFNQNLFLITICGLALIKMFMASPVDLTFLDDLMDGGGSEYEISPERDLKFDRRQNGTENLRLNVDGVIIAFPASTSSQATNAVSNLAANYLLQLAAADDDDDNDYFPFLKNANHENGITAPNDKGTATAQSPKDDKNSKKKSSPPGAPKEPTKDSDTKRNVAVVKENVKDTAEVADVAITTVEQQQQPKIEVIPAKKVQSRRKNK